MRHTGKTKTTKAVPKDLKKVRVKLKKGEAVKITDIANGLADNLICRHGLRKAFVIAKLIHEKVFANYKKMEREYGEVT